MGERRGLTRALRHRPFLLLWFGQTISQFGSAFHSIALAWWVMQKTGSGLAMGTALICNMIPQVPFMLIGGAVSDRFNRIRIMLYSDVGCAVLSALIALLMATDRLEIWHIYVLAFAFGTLQSFFVPAVYASVAELVPSEDRPSANSLRTLSRQFGNVLGPIAGASIIQAGESELAFAIDAGTFVVSSLCLLPLRHLQVTPPRDSEETSVIADVRGGLTYVKREPWLWISIVAFLFINLAEVPLFSIVVTFIITQNLHEDAAGFGLVQMAAAIGMIAAAIWNGRRGQLPKRGWIIYGWVAANGLVGIALALPLSVYGVAGLALFGGFGNAMIMLVWTNLMQDRVPTEQLGRVGSIDNVSAILTIPLGMAVVGWALDCVDTYLVCVTAGGITVATAVLTLLHPKIRQID